MVYEDGKKLYFDLNSKGYIMNIKAPSEIVVIINL